MDIGMKTVIPPFEINFQLVMHKIYFSFALLLIFALELNGQTLDTFSQVRSEFIVQLKDYMTSNKMKNVEDVYKEFANGFNGGMFSDEEVNKIYEVGNAMLALRLSPSPYFSEYFDCLSVIKKNAPSEEQLQEWHLVIERLLESIEQTRRTKPLRTFLAFTKPFYEKKALKYSEFGTSWFALSDKFQLDIIDNEPVVRFDEVDLMSKHKQDSMVVSQTSGVFYPTSQLWQGKGGKVYWDRLQQEGEEEIYVEFPEYSLEVSKNIYSVEDARLYYPQYLGKRLVKGTFSDKIVAVSKGGNTSFPRFKSYEQQLEIGNIGDGIEYNGGVRIQGTTIYGEGTRENPSRIRIFDEKGKLMFKGNSEQFVIRQGTQLYGEKVEASVYCDQDSIFHPSVGIRFNIPEKEMTLIRGDKGADKNPFFSSFHQVNINADRMVAYFDKDSVVIGKEAVQIFDKPSISFQSLHFFNESDYFRLQNIASVNPIATIKKVAEDQGLNYLDAGNLAKRLNPNYEVKNIESLLYEMVAGGFINYDDVYKEVEVKDKVFHYANAKQQKVDYDVLQITSDTSGVNAQFNYKDNYISIDGVDRIQFSEKQRVGIKPKNNRVILKENRNLDFDGKLFAGLSVITGKKFHFNYEKFRIELDTIDYFDLFVPTGELDKKGRPLAFGIDSRIEDLTGVLMIDAPHNKSGQEEIKIFPSLQTTDYSYVYYDRADIQDSVYSRDNFYFRLDPFGIDHLDYYLPVDINFKGKLFPADIFPVISDTLKLQPDGSLGLTTETPGDGNEVYNGKGQYTGIINLSNQGLEGKGRVKYLGASLDAEDIDFRPEQMTAKADEFNLEEDRESEVEVPQAKGLDVSINWRPFKDSMYIDSENNQFYLFKEEKHRLEGQSILTPGGLKGNGIFNWDRANMTSDYFSFGAFSVESDTTSLDILAYNSANANSKPALTTQNVKAFVDFDEQRGEFLTNDKFSKTSLPYNGYETSMNEFEWEIEKELVKFNSDVSSLGRFLSIIQDQDSLRFLGETANYDLTTNTLKVGGVPHIVSADALVYPDSGKVEIQAGGIMTTLENARIVADTVTKYHVINRATVSIKGRKNYTGSGFYEYNVGDKKQEIEFANIIGTRVGKGPISQRPTATRAKGSVQESDNFIIDLKTGFQGSITLSSDSKNLFFDGFAKINSDKIPQPYWFSVKSEGDKKDLAIEYDRPLSPEGDRLSTGIFLSRETSRIYPSVMMPLYYRKDRPILPVTGYFKYDEANDEFILGDSTRIFTEQVRGNKLVLNNKTGLVRAEGAINIGSGLKLISVTAAGKTEAEFLKELPKEEPINPNIMLDEPVNPDSVEVAEPAPPVNMKIMAGITMAIPEKFLKIIADDIISSAFATPNVSYLTDLGFYKMAASQVFPDNPEIREALAFMSSGYLEVPKKFNPFDFFFSRLELTWDSEYQSFVNTTEKMGLSSISGEPVNKMIEGFIEFKMPSNEDDRLYIYLKSPSGYYYFMGFKQGILDLTSDNPRFNEELLKMKKNDLLIKLPSGEELEIQPVEQSRAKLFLRRMQVIGK
jgi:hypothetical protein